MPRIEPGANVVAISEGKSMKVFEEDFYIRVLKMQSGKPPRWKFWAKAAPQIASFRAYGVGGFCREFTNMPAGKAGVYPGLNEVTVLFLGVFRGRARFEVRDFPKVDDDDLRVEQNQSVRVPGTDLTISVVRIDEVPGVPSGPVVETEAKSVPIVTYLARRGANTNPLPSDPGVTPPLGVEQFAGQKIGQVVHFDNSFDIEVDEILPSQVHFRVRAAAQLGFLAAGTICTQ